MRLSDNPSTTPLLCVVMLAGRDACIFLGERMKNQQIEKVRKGIRASQRMLGITNKRINEGRYELAEANLRGEVQY